MAATVPQQQVSVASKLAQINEQTWMTMGNYKDFLECNLAELMTDYDKAISCYDAALKHNPYSIVALSQVASLCRGREQFGRAVEYFKRILSIQENNGETWAAIGHCYLMMDNLQEAYQAYQQALYHLSNPKDPKLWYGIGILYDRYGSLEHAEEAFSAVMKMDPKFEKANEIYFRLGIIYKQQQKYDLSLQCFRYILHNPPRPLTESDIWFQTGHVYEQQKEYELAKEAYERVLAENPEHAKVLQQLGWLYHQQNTSFCNQALAIQYLTRSLKADSNDAQSWYLLGRCYMAEQNYNKAYEAYQQAVYRDARNPTFWCSIGVLYYQINQYRDALDAYSRAIRLNPYISEVWYDLVQDALDAYQRAAELDPNNPHIKQRLELLRKSQNVPSAPSTIAPVPQDVSNPTQYQSGQPSQQQQQQQQQQPLSLSSAYGQSAPTGPPSTLGSQPHRPDERVPTPQLPVVNHPMMGSHEPNSNGLARDLPMPGSSSSVAAVNRRSPAPSATPSSSYSQYPQQQQQQQQREDVRIPDIGAGGGRAPTPSDRSQMNPILHDERNYQNLPPMTMRQPYSKPSEETRSPVMSSPHARPRNPSALTASYDHRLSSPRTTEYRYEQRSPAHHIEVDHHRQVSPRSTPSNVYRKPDDYYHREEKKEDRKDDQYDTSAADALLSMGNPQLGQKRALQQEQEENKKPRQNAEPGQEDKMDIDHVENKSKKELDTVPTEEPRPQEKEEVEEVEKKEEEKNKEKERVKEEPEEGEVEEQEEGEVNDDDEEEEEGSIAPTAAVAATNAVAAALHPKEDSS
ncbi:hypothetical protein BD560DRAFT_484455 [Blakeslea trispora]|nr:hypothetical protein BD560DRAFT_484455 [Blakeslea trispora]